MSFVNVTVDIARNTLTGPGGRVQLRHHQAATFLAELARCAAAPDSPQLCAVTFATLWSNDLIAALPDRTAMRRVVIAAQAGLVEAKSTSLVLSLPRKATTGPWRLAKASGERWMVLPTTDNRVSFAALALKNATFPKPPSAGNSGPSLSVRATPRDTLRVLATVLVADDLARQALYADAVRHLDESQGSLNLSIEAAMVFALRKVRWLRRAGNRAQALETLANAEPIVVKAHPLAKGALKAEFALQTARLLYDGAPTQNAHKINFERIHQQIENAASPKLLWEAANLQALACRRKLQALLARSSPVEETTLQRTAAKAQACFDTSLYWLVVADDPYHLQAVLVNFAYHLQWPLQRSRVALVADAYEMADVVEAWRLSQAVVEKFELPEDSAWDFIMLADLWLGQGAARELIRTDWRLWPSQRSPAFAAFYERAVALAMQTGDARQQALALDRQAAFCKESGNARDANKALQARNALLAADQNLEAQLANEVLWAGGGRNLNLKNRLQLVQTPQER